MFDKFGSWKEFVLKTPLSGLVEELSDQIDILYENNIVYPVKDKIYRVFEECPYDDVKVVILGQD